MIDVSTLTREEIDALYPALAARYAELEAAAADEARDLNSQIAAAVASLDALIGTPGVKNTTSIHGVLCYSGQEMVTSAAVALPLAFQGLLRVAETLRDVAVATTSPAQ